jgi:hypothetical protein
LFSILPFDRALFANVMAKGKIKIKCCETAFLVLSLQGSPKRDH